MSRSYRIAIVGSGPAGMYTIEHLLESGLDVEVDLYECLPTPWGLARSGVAPDHPEKKMVIDRLFQYFLSRPQVRLLANVEVGKHIRHDELAEWYDAVIYAVGASSDVQMGIPGEELPGSWAAREFVAWYNGHPDYSHLLFDLSHERVVVVGNGNVALDVARILTVSPDELAKTDIADYALTALRGSQVKEVVLLGRRNHLNGAFNNAELEELEHLDGVEICVETEDFPTDNEVVLDDADWQTRRKVETLKRFVARQVPHAKKKIIFRFLSSPVELLGDNKVEQVLVARNHLEHDESGRLRARPSGEENLLDAGMVLRSIGYRGSPFPGLPFDEQAGVIANDGGRISDTQGVVPGAYVAGWIKRGPRGIIGTNKQCSRETVRHLVEDLNAGRCSEASLNADEVLALVQQRQPEIINRSDWLKIDRAEVEAGRAVDRPRIKITNTAELLSVAAS